MPADVTLEPETSVPVRLILKIPPAEGDFDKIVVLFDSKRGCHQTLHLTGKARDFVSISKRVFPIKVRGRRTIEADLTLNLPGFTFDQLFFKFPAGPDVVGYRIVPQSATQGRLIVELLHSDDSVPVPRSWQCKQIRGMSFIRVTWSFQQSNHPQGRRRLRFEDRPMVSRERYLCKWMACPARVHSKVLQRKSRTKGQ